VFQAGWTGLAHVPFGAESGPVKDRAVPPRLPGVRSRLSVAVISVKLRPDLMNLT